jgi:predicted NBD/HSP70 family sugar kinase
MKWDQQVVKTNNKQQILGMIKRNSPLSRADISAQLGLTKGTVSSLVNELLEAKICFESGPGESSGGRRPVLLLFNECAGYSIGIDLGVNYILGVLTNLNGVIILEEKRSRNNENYLETITHVKKMIRHLLNSAPESPYGVIGIGIGVPGIVNKEGDILLAPNLGWKNMNLKSELETEFKLPVIVENEANAGAYGEKQFGAGKEFENLIYISAGIGIGTGIIINNQLYRGSGGFSGEMGHMIIKENGVSCSCGSKGCWELYASEKAIINAATIQNVAEKSTTLEYLLEHAEEKIEIQQLFQEVGTFLGIGINNISNTFNPEQIIIGNRLAMAKNWLIDPILNFIRSNTLKYNLGNLLVSFSTLSVYSTALGVTAHVIDSFLTNTVHEQTKHL